MNLKIYYLNDEKILISTFLGKNRDLEIFDLHKKVFEAYNIPNNYIYLPFETGFPYGEGINQVVRQLINQIDYFIFFDIDAIPLKKDGINKIIDKIKDKNTIWGISQQSNHIKKYDTIQHPYAGFSSIGFSSELYKKLGQPTFSETFRGDIGEELTWKCEELGFNVCLSYPTSFYELTEQEIQLTGNSKFWNLNNNIKFGLGTIFGHEYYHSFMASVPRSKSIFIEKALNIIDENKKNSKIECIIISNNYGDYLELSLKENVKYFDNIIVVTSEQDSKTQDICKKYTNVNCYIYDGWNKNNAKFNFGGARNFGTQFLKYNDWVVFLDSDIIIKEDFKTKLVDKNKFYGSYRRFIPSINDYHRLLDEFYENNNLLESYGKIEGSGCGFFQCIHFNRLENFKKHFGYIYPDSYSAEQIDIDFLRQFCKFDGQNYENLVRLNIEIWHLGNHGINNFGRTEQDVFFNL